MFTDPDDNELLGMDKLIINEKVHVKEIKERMQKPGTIDLNFHLKNDSYRGFDKKCNVKINVLKEVKRAAVEYDEEDIQAAKAPSLMQSMMELNPEGDSDDELSEDENNGTSIKTAATATAGDESPEAKKEK